jgi:membrane protein CcdC involved in cytochrome C biogenesis
MKNLWLKFQATKFYAFLVKVIVGIRETLRYAFATQISYLALAGLLWLLVGKWLGIPLVVWGILLLVAEVKQQKADKKK